jgi:hypothetical protein
MMPALKSIDSLEPIEMLPPENHVPSRRKRGRPLEMPPAAVLARIRTEFEQGTLFRMHREQPALYARARRLFGSWANAVAAAGVDHDRAIADARRRSLETRRRARHGVAR